MHQVPPENAVTATGFLSVVHQVTGALERFVTTEAQREVLQAICEHERVIVLKGRQVYISTACCLYALLFALINPSVKVALVADVADKAEGLLAKCSSWARQMGVPLVTDNTKVLGLWNGAEIHAITANSGDTGSDEVKAGRSFSYGLIVLSEFAYYNRDAALLAALTRSALAGARIVIESTATPADNVFRALWERGKGWHKVFVSFERHTAYQLPADSIDDATFSSLQQHYGFRSRTHAAYWWRMVQTDMAGDVHRGLREAPILPAHAFAFAEGRWIFRLTEAEPRRVELGGGLTFAEGIPGGWRYYDEPDESGVVIGIDTGGGVGADASAIAVIGRARGNLVATFVSRNLVVPDFIEVAKDAAAQQTPAGTHVEGNGIGKAVYQALCLLPVARTQEHWSEEAEKPVRMNLVKLAIESGQVVAGPELAYEVTHSEMLRPKKNRGSPVWDGPDDLLNALGFALVWRRDNPLRSAPKGMNPRTHIDRRSIRSRKKRRLM